MSTKPVILILFILIIGGVSAGHFAGGLPLPIVDVHFTSEIPYNADRTTGKRPGGQEVVMVFVGSPNCGACNHPELAPLVREATETLRERAASEDAPLVSVGVSPTWVPGEGWRFLTGIMNFDEVVIGRSWLNSELVDLAWSDPNADVATPQIIVYRQSVVLPSDIVRASISREAPTVRATGLLGIREWVESGCPLEWRN